MTDLEVVLSGAVLAVIVYLAWARGQDGGNADDIMSAVYAERDLLKAEIFDLKGKVNLLIQENQEWRMFAIRILERGMANGVSFDDMEPPRSHTTTTQDGHLNINVKGDLMVKGDVAGGDVLHK